MSSQITHAQLSKMHTLAHILGTSALIFSCRALFTVYPNRISNGIPSFFKGISHQRAVRKTQEPSKNGCVELPDLHMHQGFPLPPIFRTLRCLYRHLPATQGHLHIIHPNPVNASSALYLLTPSTPF